MVSSSRDMKDHSLLNFHIRDNWANELTCHRGRLMLRLASENGRVRKIGEIFWFDYSKITHGGKGYLLTYGKNEKEKDTFHKLNAWSIYDEIVNRVDVIVYSTKEWMYFITAEKAMEMAMDKDGRSGQFKHFLESGYERKIYINKDHWGKRKDPALKKKEKKQKEKNAV